MVTEPSFSIVHIWFADQREDFDLNPFTCGLHKIIEVVDNAVFNIRLPRDIPMELKSVGILEKWQEWYDRALPGQVDLGKGQQGQHLQTSEPVQPLLLFSYKLSQSYLTVHV